MFRNQMIKTFRRGAHSRVKKIPVQLLKDFPGIGARGEVVQVTEGMMRNKLHTGNGAAYVLEGEPLRIPLKQRAKPELAVEPTEGDAPEVATEVAAEQQATKEPSVLDFLKFSSSTNAEKQPQPTESEEIVKNTDNLDPLRKKPQPTESEEIVKNSTDAKPFEWQNDIVANIDKKRRQ